MWWIGSYSRPPDPYLQVFMSLYNLLPLSVVETYDLLQDSKDDEWTW